MENADRRFDASSKRLGRILRGASRSRTKLRAALEFEDPAGWKDGTAPLEDMFPFLEPEELKKNMIADSSDD